MSRRQRPEIGRPAPGYTLPLVLVLLLVVAAFSVSALDEAMTNRALAGARLAQQRAFLAASSGLNLALAALQDGNAAGASRQYPLPGPADRVQVEVRSTLRNPLPVGYSAGHFVEQFYEVHSTGSSLRGARSVQVQGLRRVELAEPPAAPAEPAP